eukprot:747624-Hanusia_phi.AAC.1
MPSTSVFWALAGPVRNMLLLLVCPRPRDQRQGVGVIRTQREEKLTEDVERNAIFATLYCRKYAPWEFYYEVRKEKGGREGGERRRDGQDKTGQREEMSRQDKKEKRRGGESACHLVSGA